MNFRRRDIAALGIATAGLAAAVKTAPAIAQPKMSDSTWELIKKNGQVRMEAGQVVEQGQADEVLLRPKNARTASFLSRFHSTMGERKA